MGRGNEAAEVEEFNGGEGTLSVVSSAETADIHLAARLQPASLGSRVACRIDLAVAVDFGDI